MSSRIENIHQAGMRRYEIALRKERDIKRRALKLLENGQVAAVVALLENHLRKMGELDRG